MKLPIIPDGLSANHAEPAARPVPRNKHSLATTFCPGATASWARAPRASGPYQYGDGCFCLSPEQHGAQFRRDGWELISFKGHC
jgi:hypothetical protein